MEDIALVRKKLLTVEDIFFYIGNMVILIIMIVWPWFLRHQNDFVWGCIFNRLTGFCCPSCGGTRAFNAMLHGHFLQSLRYHPIVLYFSVIFTWFMVSWYIEKLSRGHIRIGMKYRDIYVFVGIALLVLNFIIKNILILANIAVL